MTSTTIKNAQEYLTIIRGDQVKKIIDIEILLHKHNKKIVINFLEGMYREYSKILKNLVITERSSSKIDDTISRMFRIFMAIRVIERESEEVIAA